jgi:hypothetical protein
VRRRGASSILSHDAATFWEPFIAANCAGGTANFAAFFASRVPFARALQSPNVEWAKARFIPAVVRDLVSGRPDVCGLPRTTDAERDAIVDLTYEIDRESRPSRRSVPWLATIEMAPRGPDGQLR